ncbi:hypothetical protein RvY_08553-2 [Ramazzottius varieornatus]|uniref:Uncharacterized protein n=1 Tax=Ramazzottius varieornatus TaxID=947166 RepID=A0A1D1VBV7_RAMVA|nr:hypothetical protein RvY_08553-2 [Ramazzottius varieornatus]
MLLFKTHIPTELLSMVELIETGAKLERHKTARLKLACTVRISMRQVGRACYPISLKSAKKRDIPTISMCGSPSNCRFQLETAVLLTFPEEKEVKKMYEHLRRKPYWTDHHFKTASCIVRGKT